MSDKAHQRLTVGCCSPKTLVGGSVATSGTDALVRCWNGSERRHPKVRCNHQRAGVVEDDQMVSGCVCRVVVGWLECGCLSTGS